MGDDRYGIDDLGIDPDDEKHVRLEDIPPDKFEGDRAKTHQFLTKFKRYMSMNHKAMIAKDPISRAAYFLSLVGGGTADGWVERQYA
jgi:hypothetical protein